MRTELTLLKWAAGLPVTPPSPAQCDSGVLLPALWQHKLTGRLLSRIETQRPEWASQPLVAELRRQQRDVRQNVRIRRGMIREIGAAISQLGDRPLLVVKGITSYVLTGDRTFLRRSNDIDLMWHDPAELANTIGKLGFLPADDHCRSHEYAAMYRDGVKADIHSYFPTETSADSADVSQAPSGPVHTRAFSESGIYYDAALDGSRSTGMTGVVVPGPEVAVLIAAAHCYREYAHEPFPLPHGTVRIGELIEIDAIARNPRFDATKFCRLAESYSASQSVDFANHMLTSGLGASPIPARGEPDGGRQLRYPYDLWLDGFVVLDDRAHDADVFFLRPPGITMGEFVRRLGAVDGVGAVCYATTPALGGPVPPARFLCGEAPAATVALRCDERGLDAEVSLARTERPGRSLYLMLNTGDILHEFRWSPQDRTVVPSWQRNHAAGRQWRHALDGTATSPTRLTLRLPLTALDPPGERGTRPLLVGLRWAPERRNADGIVVPVIVRP